jgi:isopenicillin N synthase-like dioxygenase
MAIISINDRNPTDRTTYEEAHKGAASYLQSRLTEKDDRLDEQFEVPVIDLAPSYSRSLSDRQAVAARIRKACTTSGFFYIANHSVPEHTRAGILEQSKRFYDELSIDQKKKLHIEKSKLGLGWEPSEYTSIAGDQECKEGFNFAYEAAMDPTGGDGLYRNLDGTECDGNMWPEEGELPGFFEAVKEYYGGVSSLSHNKIAGLTHILGTRSCSPPIPTICALP